MKNEKFSLRKEIHRRKTQEMVRIAEAKRASQTLNRVPQRVEVDPLPEPEKPLTAPAEIVEPALSNTVESKPSTGGPSLPRLKRLLPSISIDLIMGIIVIAATLGLVIPSLIITRSVPNQRPAPNTMKELLPIVSATDTLNYFTNAKVPITSTVRLPRPTDPLTPNEEIQLQVVSGNSRGIVMILSYTSPEKAAEDRPKLAQHPIFKTWNILQSSNVIVLLFPGMGKNLADEIAVKFSQYFSQK